MTKWDFLRFWQRPSSANKKKSVQKQEGGDSRSAKSIRRNCQLSRNMEDITNRPEIDLDYKMSLMKKSQSWEPSMPHPRVLRKIAAYEKDYLPSGMIPEPDYDQEDDIHEKKTQKDILVDENGLILPRKPSNPCLTSTERRDLHRELLFNQKRGINVLNQKTELQKALEKHNDSKQKKIAEAEKELNKTCFEKMLAQQAKKLEERTAVVQSAPGSNELNSEFLKVHAKVRARMNSE